MILSNGEQIQILLCGDLLGTGGAAYETLLRQYKPGIIYSDPPWNQSNLTWWLRHAGLRDYRLDFQDFVARWAELAQGVPEIFCEQSSNERSRSFLMRAVEKLSEFPALLEKFDVTYGSGRYPNQLLHFGEQKLLSDPTGLHGEKMTRTVFEGIVGWRKNRWVADPCLGKGMTSRMVHRFGLNCIGLELNPCRLEVAKRWLIKNGYS